MNRVESRKSETRSGRKARVTATLFTREETDGPSGEFVDAIRSYESKAVIDPFTQLYGINNTFSMVAPDMNPWSLIKLPNESSALRQCIDAMVTNIVSFGYRLEFVGEKGEEESDAAQAEKTRIENIMEQPNDEYTVVELRERTRRDIETFGYGFTELGRDQKGEIVMINHVPAQTVRMTAKLAEVISVDTIIRRGGELISVKIGKRFRRFVQQIGAKLVYFKEFGDPRAIDPATGQENTSLPFPDQATEIYHHSLYSPGSPYGVPRWTGNLPAIRGTRESELTNLQFFSDNAIPAMAILVSGGALTGDTVGNLESHFTTARGRGAMNRVVVIEATGDDNAAKVEGTIPAPKLEMKPLASDRQTDGLFKEYEESNEKKIRASFRLPPIFVGRTDDYTHATADASLVMADAQVFGPERNKEDDVWNSQFLPINRQPLRYWRIRTNPPRLVSADSILAALNILDDLGAVTPNIAIGIANELFDLSIKPVEFPWGDFPFPIVMQLCINNNLQGIETIEKVANLLQTQQENESAALANQTKITEAKGKSPQAAAGKKPTAVKPKVSEAQSGPGNKVSSKAEVARKIEWAFRSVANRGNDITAPLTYKTRKRSRANPPKVIIQA